MIPLAQPVPTGLLRCTGAVATPAGWVRGAIEFNHRIVRIEGVAIEQPAAFEPVLLPGFVDLHVHGGGGADVMAGQGAVDTIARTHARHGTTSLLATTMTAPRAQIEHALRDIGRAMRAGTAPGARVLGAHLEGPFISSQRLGAQPAFARPATWEEVQALHALAPLRVITLAPEALGDATDLQRWQAAGIVAQLGHSNATFEEGQAALQAGARGFTHLFNAMSALHHRQPGLVGLALAQAEFAEIIPDLLHVHPGALQAALRAIPKLYAVTDATAGTDMPDGPYLLGSQPVCKCAGGVRLADGTLAGSVLTMDQALRNLVALGQPLWDAARRVATYPAQYLGESDIGHLSPGARADVVQLSPALQVQRVWVGGQEVPLK
jgi:N-acetylglucosamine-6-phosphate deacetylase